MARIYQVENPSNTSQLHDIGFERNISFLNGYTTQGFLMRKSLCAFAKGIGGMMYATSFTSNNGVGGTGNKTVIKGNKFPIGSKIYYYDDDTDIQSSDLSNGNFTSLQFYDSFESVDARYTATNGSSVSLSGSSNSNVYLLVSVVENYKYWSIVSKGNTEIIVTGNNLVSGNFYIYLGKTNGNSNAYTFQLEDNNPLYYYDGTDLIEFTTYMISQGGGGSVSTQNGQEKIISQDVIQVYLHKNIFDADPQIHGTEFPAAGIFQAKKYLDSTIVPGVYKVTVQMHFWWDNKTDSSFAEAQPISIEINFNEDRNKEITAGTYTIASCQSPNQSGAKTQYFGSTTAYMSGILSVSSTLSSSDYIEINATGPEGVSIGGEQPLHGSQAQYVNKSDFVLLERIGEYIPT